MEPTKQTPIIISASRSTDIPAFYAEWFVNRLKAGYVVWKNPFNNKPMRVSFEKCKVIVFWTKNPKPVIPYLGELEKRGIHYYFQFTFNDYDAERFEPNVPSVLERVETFKELSDLIGKDRVIWRFDPLIVTKNLTPRKLVEKVWRLGEQLKGYTNKLVISFIDILSYKKVQANLIKETSEFSKENISESEMTTAQMEEIAGYIQKCKQRWAEEGWDLSIGTCGEKIDLDKYGIEHNRCIDGELMKTIFADDKELVYYLNYGKMPDNKLFVMDEKLPIEKLKDKGQRKLCGCMVSKDIGMYNTCSHFCVYCYANTSRETVKKNQALINKDSESLIPL